MSSTATSPTRVRVDPANPGQFFACCGLLELANRLWSGVEGWFEGDTFCIRDEQSTASLPRVLDAAKAIQLTDNGAEPDRDENEDEEEFEDSEKESPLLIAAPISLQLDWWGDKSLKTWAGSMDARKIFLAMCNAIDPAHDDPLNQGLVVFDAMATVGQTGRGKRGAKPKKREPFYFDGRRGASAWSIDVGFAPDSLKLTTVAYPVVESMCLVGLQRCRPRPPTSLVFLTTLSGTCRYQLRWFPWPFPVLSETAVVFALRMPSAQTKKSTRLSIQQPRYKGAKDERSHQEV